MNMLTAILLLCGPCKRPCRLFLSPYITSPSPTSHVRFSLATGRRRLSMRVSPFSLLSSVACCVAVYSVYCAFRVCRPISILESVVRVSVWTVECGRARSAEIDLYFFVKTYMYM